MRAIKRIVIVKLYPAAAANAPLQSFQAAAVGRTDNRIGPLTVVLHFGRCGFTYGKARAVAQGERLGSPSYRQKLAVLLAEGRRECAAVNLDRVGGFRGGRF